MVVVGLLLVALSAFAVPVLAYGVGPEITVLRSPSHPDSDTGYASRNVSFHWEGSPTNHVWTTVGGPCDYGVQFKVVGDLVYAAATEGLMIFDAAGSSPGILGSFTDVGAVLAVDVAGTTAYCVVDETDPRAVQLVDVSDPSAPTAAGYAFGPVEGDLFCRAIAARNNCVYVVIKRQAGFFEYDYYLGVIDLSAKIWSGFAAVSSDVRSLLFVGDYLYAGEDTCLEVFDVSDSAAPVRIKSISGGSSDCGTMALDGSYLHVSGYSDASRVFDVSNPASPYLLGELECAETYLYDNRALGLTDLSLDRHYLLSSFYEPDAPHYVDILDATSPITKWGTESLLLKKGNLTVGQSAKVRDIVTAGDWVFVGFWGSESMQLSWIGPSAYSYVFDRNPATEPDTVPDGADVGLGAYALLTANADGVWYFHVRAKSETEWGPTSHLKVTVGDGSTTVPLEHDAAGVVFDRFVTGYSDAYSGGGYVYGRWTGTALKASFTGSSIKWIGPKQPSYGMADVYIDGVIAKWNVDCYAPDAEKTLSATLWESATLADGPHTIEIRLSGWKNAASTGYVVVLDKFEVTGTSPSGLGTRIDDSTAAPGYTGTWLLYINPTYFNKTYAYSRWTNAAFTLAFTGTRVSWIGPRTTNYGMADVYIDGAKVATVDCFRAELAYQGWREVVWQSAVLSPGAHTLSIRPTGAKNAAATAANVVIDAIDVTP